MPRDLAIGPESRSARQRRRGEAGRRRRRSLLVNDADSPLAAMADHLLPLHAGAERSVAATKSFIASLAALVALVAAWTEDAELTAALAAAPALPCRGVDGRLVGAGRAADRGARPLRRRPRPRARRRPGGRAQAQGDLRPARRGVQRRRTAPRADGAGRPRFPAARLSPVGRDRGQHRRAGPRRGGARRRRARRRRCAGRRHRPAERPRPSGDRADAADPELLPRRGRARSAARGHSIPTGRRTSPRSRRRCDGDRAPQRPGAARPGLRERAGPCIIEGRAHRRDRRRERDPRRRRAGRPRRRDAGARLHRRPGQWRRRRPVQRRADGRRRSPRSAPRTGASAPPASCRH